MDQTHSGIHNARAPATWIEDWTVALGTFATPVIGRLVNKQILKKYSETISYMFFFI